MIVSKSVIEDKYGIKRTEFPRVTFTVTFTTCGKGKPVRRLIRRTIIIKGSLNQAGSHGMAQ